MKVLEVLLVVIFIITTCSALEQKNEIDVVLKLFQDLQGNVQSELDSLDKGWEETNSKKASAIESLTRSVQQQRGECQNRDQDVAFKERDISITLNFINWLERRIKENNARIKLLDENRCDSNGNHINHLKNNKMFLNMIRFLRRAIKNASQSDLPALLEMPEFKQNLKMFLQLSKKETHLKFVGLQQNFEVKEENETAEELSVENFDMLANKFDPNDIDAAPQQQEIIQQQRESAWLKDQEELKSEATAFANLIAEDSNLNSEEFTAAQQSKELLSLLDEMEQEILNEFSHAQDNQIKSAGGYNDFKILIVKENQTFDQHLISENENLKKLENQLINTLKASAACKARLQQINQALQFANEDLNSGEEGYKSTRERLISQLDLFGDVYRVYKTQVSSQSVDYKQSIQQKIDRR